MQLEKLIADMLQVEILPEDQELSSDAELKRIPLRNTGMVVYVDNSYSTSEIFRIKSSLEKLLTKIQPMQAAQAENDILRNELRDISAAADKLALQGVALEYEFDFLAVVKARYVLLKNDQVLVNTGLDEHTIKSSAHKLIHRNTFSLYIRAGELIGFKTTSYKLIVVSDEILDESIKQIISTKLNWLERMLQQTSQELEAVFEVIPDLFLRVDNQGILLDSRGSLVCGLHNFTGENLGKPLYGVLLPDVTEQFRAALESCLSNNARETVEFSSNRCNGIMHYESRFVPLSESQAVIIIRDITYQKEVAENQHLLLDRVESINSELKDFAYIVSHDLKAPLRSIKSISDWLISDYQEQLDDSGKEMLDLLGSRVLRMHNLIEGVLAYSRVGQANEDRVLVDLQQSVKDVTEMLSPPENIEIQVLGSLPTLRIGKTRIEQVFQNFLSNAIKYMDKENGKVEVSYTRSASECIFCIKDNGPGISEKHFDRIFRIFQTVSGKESFENTGVGLSIIKKIVENYGGRVWIESVEGEGSSFFFSLPNNMSVNASEEEPVAF
ncbi:MAG: sensor histidine kinase [Calditrichia bacterium]